MHLLPLTAIDRGIPGVSAPREADLRRAQHDAAIEAWFRSGRTGRVAKCFSDEPRTATAFAKGSDGGRRLGVQLARDLATAWHPAGSRNPTHRTARSK